VSEVYDIVTAEVVRLLEEGTAPWRRPWTVERRLPTNLVSKRESRGANVFLLGVKAALKGYGSPYWVTFKQALDLGGHVRKGEKSTLAIFWRTVEKEDPETGEAKEYPVLRYYSVFNTGQCDGLPVPPAPEADITFDPIEAAETIIRNMPSAPAIRHGGDQAFYAPLTDHVQLPKREAFETPAAYYGCAFHELTHSTGHK
jgi:antirestriction protein ArdC